VPDDIRALTAQLAQDPTSLVFLRLGEALRLRGQLDAALKVALQGLSRYPHLPDAHDLYARILADKKDYATAFDEWDTVLRLAPNHVGAHKGIGFLYYRAGDPEQALYHLRLAAAADPADEGLRAAVERVAGGREIWDQPLEPPVQAPGAAPEPAGASAPASAGPDEPFRDLEGGGDRVLLVDRNGLRVGGALRAPDGRDVSDAAAAALSALAREAARAARLLELGEWSQLTVECDAVSFAVQQPAPDASLLAAVDAGVPAGQLAIHADRAARAARAWLERIR
jgi:tetratricopeptide (TPR) repeat protein